MKIFSASSEHFSPSEQSWHIKSLQQPGQLFGCRLHTLIGMVQMMSSDKQMTYWHFCKCTISWVVHWTFIDWMWGCLVVRWTYKFDPLFCECSFDKKKERSVLGQIYKEDMARLEVKSLVRKSDWKFSVLKLAQTHKENDTMISVFFYCKMHLITHIYRKMWSFSYH